MKNLIKSLILPAIFLTCGNLVSAQNTYVPDDNFEQALINLGYDSGALDDYVPTANITDVASLNLYNLGISDLTGIEDFSSLLVLNFSSNNVSTADLSTLTQLIELALGNNQITDLDLSTNTALEQLFCGNNQLTSLNLQHNINLEYLACNNNQITDLHFENSAQLQSLFIQGNQLSTVDLQYNSLLYELGCDNNPLTTLDLSGNTEIHKLFCSHTEISLIIFPEDCKIYRLSCESANLTEIDVSTLQDLDFLSVWNNDITTLDLSNNLLLTELLCGQNQLESLLIPKTNIINKIDARNNRLSNLEEILNVDTGSNTIKEQNPSLITLNILRNNFVFADFEPRWTELTQIPAFSYDEQNFIGVQGDTSIELGTDLTLEITGYLPATSDQYQWYNNLEMLDGETGQTLELGSVDFGDSGAYHCEVTNTAVPDLTLESFTMQVLVTTVGTEDLERTAIKVYPNPTSEYISFESEEHEIHFQLFNSEGKKIIEGQSFSSGEIIVDHLPKGLYILKVDAIGSRATKRVILY